MRRRNAFTLVELLVVCGIISVLLAVLIPSLAAARATARALNCSSNLRQLGIALISYAGDNRNHFPPNLNSPSPGMYWYDLDRIGDYLAATILTTSGKPGDGVMQCPADESGRRSFAMNIWASSATDGIADQTRGVRWDATVSNASNMLLLIEALSTTGSSSAGYFAPATVGYAGTTSAERFGANGGVSPSISGGRWGNVACQLDFARHRQGRGPGQLNVFYADGHVKTELSTALTDATGALTGEGCWSPSDWR